MQKICSGTFHGQCIPLRLTINCVSALSFHSVSDLHKIGVSLSQCYNESYCLWHMSTTPLVPGASSQVRHSS